jgi:hypothetical protein
VDHLLPRGARRCASRGPGREEGAREREAARAKESGT